LRLSRRSSGGRSLSTACGDRGGGGAVDDVVAEVLEHRGVDRHRHAEADDRVHVAAGRRGALEGALDQAAVARS
jgi:hypothetical protein